jgi:hypothetical protein
MLCKSLGFTTSDDEILPEESLRGGVDGVIWLADSYNRPN